ncbi:hypothetical protein AAGW04_06960 [Pectobacterium aroidearum]|uniref:hypothetical protein n=1 Tax=Pectobacterium aroidearum TaxID=1201031 RepID=UPI0031593E06
MSTEQSKIKMTVMIQYMGHVVNAGGNIEYRAVELELTEQQSEALALQQDEYYGPVAFSAQPV